MRRRGLDPVVDRSAIRSLIDEVVSEYDACCLTLPLPLPLPLADSRLAAKAVYDAVAGYGPLQRHLDDPRVERVDQRAADRRGGYSSPGTAGRS